jgi:hypothetical protein
METDMTRTGHTYDLCYRCPYCAARRAWDRHVDPLLDRARSSVSGRVMLGADMFGLTFRAAIVVAIGIVAYRLAMGV